MTTTNLSDAEGKAVLRTWPAHSAASFFEPPVEGGRWLRAQPADNPAPYASPRIATVGAEKFATQPDGLWVFFGEEQAWVDVFAVEVCRSIQNLNDKRSRYSATMHAKVLTVSLGWLTHELPVGSGSRARWEIAGTLSNPLESRLVPIRHLRAVYALPNEHFTEWARDQVPEAHEYFVRHSSLASHTSQRLRRFLEPSMLSEHFYTAT